MYQSVAPGLQVEYVVSNRVTWFSPSNSARSAVPLAMDGRRSGATVGSP